MEINSKYKEVAPCELLLEVEIPASEVEKSLQVAGRALNKKKELPGFRKGKIPNDILWRRFGKEIEENARLELFYSSYKEALSQHNLNPIKDPDSPNILIEKGQPYKYSVSLEVEPQFELPEYAGLEIVCQEAKVTEDSIKASLEHLQKSYAKYESTAGKPAEEEDRITLDWSLLVKENDQYSETSQGKEQTLIVGRDSMLQHKEEFLGLKEGQEVTFTGDLNIEKVEPKYAGKPYQLNLKVGKVEKSVLPELNDEFAKDIGNFESLTDLKNKLQRQMEENLEADIERKARNDVIEKLLKKVSFPVPPGLWKSETERIITQLFNDLKRADGAAYSTEKSKEVREAAKDAAHKRIRNYYLVKKVALKEGLKVTEEEIKEEMIKHAKELGLSLKETEDYFKRRSTLDSLIIYLLEKKVANFLLEKAALKIISKDSKDNQTAEKEKADSLEEQNS